MTIRPILPLLALASLAACSDAADTGTPDGAADAPVEVMEGSISDDMLPLGEVRSQAPLRDGDDTEEGGSGEDETAADADAQ